VLLQGEIDDIVPVLSQALTQTGVVNRQWLITTVATDGFSAELAARAPAAATGDEVGAAAVDIAIELGWAGFPAERTPLERLLSGLQLQQGTGGVAPLPILPAIVSRLLNGEDVREPIWTSNWLRFNEPLVDRSGLRSQLRGFARRDRDARPILRIEGEGSKIGKSHSIELMHFAREKYRTFKIAELTLEEGQETFYTSVTLAQEIVARIDTAPPSLESPVTRHNLNPQKPEKQHLPHLSNWITQAVSRSREHWWIILDKFGAASRTSLTRELIDLLADDVANGSAGSSLRLILIDFTAPLTRVNEKKRVAYDRPNPQDITSDEIKNALKAFCERAQKPRPDAELLERAKAILAALPTDHTRLVRLNDVLLPAAEELTK